jgi:hypothetical protein
MTSITVHPAPYAAMLALNLRSGFTIIGGYSRKGPRVLLAKKLDG